MFNNKDKYNFEDYNLHNIRNYYETKVIEVMRELLPTYTDFYYSQIDVEDIYALALNNMPAKYIQVGSFIFKGDIDKNHMRDIVRGAIEQVMDNPRSPA